MIFHFVSFLYSRPVVALVVVAAAIVVVIVITYVTERLKYGTCSSIRPTCFSQLALFTYISGEISTTAVTFAAVDFNVTRRERLVLIGVYVFVRNAGTYRTCIPPAV